MKKYSTHDASLFRHFRRLWFWQHPGFQVAALLIALVPCATWAQTSQPSSAQAAFNDPPGRVARLSTIEGAVSFLPADAVQGDAWSFASFNRPLTTGDRLWAAPGARAELHIGSATLRMNGQTSVDFLALDDNVTRLRLAQGSIRLRVRDMPAGQQMEIDTPNLAFVINQPGDYRLDANPETDTTRVVAQAGSATIYGESGPPLNLGSQQQGSFSGTQLTPASPGASVQDDFDIWATARDRLEDRSASARYIPREIVGYQQLDSYGDWSQDASYGAVWVPRAMPANWAPYRAGHWSWIAPWGWTWIDDAPWGFAPFHYGRWAQIGPRWAWVPGRFGPRPVYAPALVAFVGGDHANGTSGAGWNISISAGRQQRPAIGWFPLAPGESFRPAYRVSPAYVTQINRSSVVNNTVIVNNINTTKNITNNTTSSATHNNTQVYRYQHLPAALTAISTADFARGQPVRGNLQNLSQGDLNRARLVFDGAPVGSDKSARSATSGAAQAFNGALPPRPDDRASVKPAPAAALPPQAVLLSKPVVSSHGEHRTASLEEHQTGRPDARPSPPPQALAPATPQPATPIATVSTPPPAKTSLPSVAPPIVVPSPPLDSRQVVRPTRQNAVVNTPLPANTPVVAQGLVAPPRAMPQTVVAAPLPAKQVRSAISDTGAVKVQKQEQTMEQKQAQDQAREQAQQKQLQLQQRAQQNQQKQAREQAQRQQQVQQQQQERHKQEATQRDKAARAHAARPDERGHEAPEKPKKE